MFTSNNQKLDFLYFCKKNITMNTFGKIILVFAIFIAVISNPRKSSAQNKVVREVSSFDQVRVSDNVKVTFKKSDREMITVIANGIGYDKIITETSKRELRIKVKSTFYKETDVYIEVEYKQLRSIEASNKSIINFTEVVTGDEITLKATGGAVINLDVDVSAVKASLSNGGRIEIAGKADLQEVDASIGAKYNAYEFETENGFVKSNTNSDVVVWVKNKLEASAGSKAIVKYRGKPAELKSSTSLGGKISGNI